jgi:phage-related protein
MIQIASLVAKVGFKSKGAISGMKKMTSATRSTGKSIQGFTQKSQMNLDGLKKSWKFLGKFATGAIGKMISATPLLQAQMAMLNFQFREVWRTIGNALAPILEIIVEWIIKAVEWFKNLDPAIHKTIGVVLGLVAGLVALLPLLAILPALFSPITLAIGAVIIAIGLLIKAYDENFGGLRDKIDSFVANFKEKFASLIEPLKNLWEAMKELWAQIKPILEQLFGDWAGDFAEKLNTAINFIVDIFQYLIAQATEMIGFWTDLLSGDLEGAWEHLKQGFLNFGTFIWDYFSGVWDWIKEGFLGIFSAIAEALGKAIGCFNDIFGGGDDEEDKIVLPILGGTTSVSEPIGTYSSPEDRSTTTSATTINIEVNVDASGTEADAYDIATKTSEEIADQLSDIQNW